MCLQEDTHSNHQDLKFYIHLEYTHRQKCDHGNALWVWGRKVQLPVSSRFMAAISPKGDEKAKHTSVHQQESTGQIHSWDSSQLDPNLQHPEGPAKTKNKK